jgi:FkbM family methyltransferase
MAMKFIRFLKALLRLSNPVTWGPFTRAMEASKFDFDFNISWSQGGEDLALLHAILNSGNGFYIDVGAHHPNRFSVTRHLYQRGWRGVDIDANPALEQEFLSQRPENIFLNAAVGSCPEYEFYIFKEPAISTIKVEWRDNWESQGRTIKEIRMVRGITLRSVLNLAPKNSKIDLINIDVEGADFDALSSIDFESLDINLYPKWLLLETTPPVVHSLDFPAVKYAIKYGYIPFMILPMATLLKARE